MSGFKWKSTRTLAARCTEELDLADAVRPKGLRGFFARAPRLVSVLTRVECGPCLVPSWPSPLHPTFRVYNPNDNAVQYTVEVEGYREEWGATSLLRALLNAKAGK